MEEKINQRISQKQKTLPPIKLVVPQNEVTIHLEGYVQKILHVDINLSIGQIQEMNHMKKRIFLAKKCIPISPTAMIRDVYQIFKDSQGFLHITVA